MKYVLEKLADLIKVKTIVTMVVIFIFAVMALRGDIEADNVMMVVVSVIGFYFGTQHEKATATINSKEGE